MTLLKSVEPRLPLRGVLGAMFSRGAPCVRTSNRFAETPTFRSNLDVQPLKLWQTSENMVIPTLLVLLEGDDRALSRATRWALSVLTRQDFGNDIAAWRAFWQEHRDEDRVEWLIASLDHEQRDIRRAAGEELKSMTNGEIEYDEDQPSSARRIAQAQFRDWWNETGKPSGH